MPFISAAVVASNNLMLIVVAADKVDGEDDECDDSLTNVVHNIFIGHSLRL